MFSDVFHSLKLMINTQVLVHGAARLTCLVAASDKFLRVQRQFWTSLWLGSVRWSPRACMPPNRRKSRAHRVYIRKVRKCISK